MSRAEIEAKFEGLASSVASPERVRALRDAIAALPKALNLETYAGLLRQPAEIGSP